jgi:hypothetical protein
MSDKDKSEIARLEEVNERLEDSLERCRKLLKEYRSKLAANANDEPEADEDEDGQKQSGRPAAVADDPQETNEARIRFPARRRFISHANER